MTGVASSAEVQQNWGSLPREILVEILQKLQWNERLFTAPLVCHCWYDASRDPLCWKHLDFQDWDMKYWRVSENASSIFEVGIDFAKLLKILLKLANNQVTSISFPILATTNFELLYVSDR
ncbi:hypothetical protein AMTR_s00091p00086400 [Amborella trichopoda]|uniref:F-box domain-containing protein n=1 Tax=Amborella trichopoda TaxID=13333 RepID=W1NY78_AMBTC|nr:hypothetical protein AMTR_s00091p00086400 [Amborella trichopoda]